MKLTRTLVVLCALLIALLVPTILSAQSDSFTVVPRSELYQGLTYGEWANKWQQWATLLPANAHPLLDTSDCSSGQSGPVWFLGGAFCTAYNPNCNYTAVRRSCTIPSGKALFFPIFNTEYSFLEMPTGTTEAEMRSVTKSTIDSVFNVTATVDGHQVPNVAAYRICTSGSACSPTEAPLFSYTLAQHDNLYAAIGETEHAAKHGLIKNGAATEGVTDGYYILLQPLSAGAHTISFHGEMTGFVLDVAYNITVR